MEGYSDYILGHPEINFSLGLLPIKQQQVLLRGEGAVNSASGAGKMSDALGSGQLNDADGCEDTTSSGHGRCDGLEPAAGGGLTSASAAGALSLEDAAALLQEGSTALNDEADEAPTPIRPPPAL
jgi:hypothetical protein